ncbi:lipid-transfer protein [Actinoallomurus iriomotensis]|uniref:propanoyl-CoA C-acyltransferase n=1 Tax=Actinoallomurus iriomotensis TaxID=478107 RepID=A0A9W6W5Y1_9ACTN|nr:lipid-transfer protein [Actinoallomurus iriomotensis]GLY92540.1 lipid-transfer protein [Actinoallomurus iriomotensis]
MGRVRVVGVGMVPFVTPSKSGSYDAMAAAAVRKALTDAGLDLEQVQQAYAGFVYGDSTSGQRALYGVGMTGIPVVNVNNNCSTGSSALWLAAQAVGSGSVDCALAFGFEQMERGALAMKWSDRPSPFVDFMEVAQKRNGPSEAPFAAQLFGGAGAAYMEEHGTSPETFAMISVKARKHAGNNPYAVFRAPTTVEEVLASPRIFGPLTRLQCCPPTCGAAAAVIASEDFARRHGLKGDVAIAAQAMTTDQPDTFEDPKNLVGFSMAQRAADEVYEKAGVDPRDLRVVELHDCFTANELLSYEALRLTAPGTAEKFIRDGDNTYGGRVVTNPSGGLLSKGHPLGATGLAQCAELTWQLRGEAGARQVDDVRLALQHNIGLGGAAVVTLYQKVG